MGKKSKKERRIQKEKVKAVRKKRRAEKAKDRPRPWQPVKMKMFRMPDIFGDIPKEKRFEMMREAHRKCAEEFPKKLAEIEAWYDDYDPLYLLSFCWVYFISHPEGIDPEVSGRLDFPPFFAEILQALALTRERGFSPKPLFREAERFKNDVREMGDLLMMRLFTGIPDKEEDFHAEFLRKEMMANTIAVRNWAYSHQMERVYRDIAGRLDPAFERVYGLKATKLVNAVFVMVEQRSDLLTEHRNKLRSALLPNLKNPDKLISAYNSVFPENVPIGEHEVNQIWEMCGKSAPSLASMLMCHADLKLEGLFSIKETDVRLLVESDSEAEALWSLLSGLSMQFGELQDKTKEHFILDNPAKVKPFIVNGEGSLFSGMWGVLPHYMLDIIEFLVWPDPQLKAKLAEVKAEYLEDEVCRIFTQGFPSAQIFPGIVWIGDDGKQYENDLTVVIDTFAIVVEAKSAAVTDPAKRGAPGRLFKTLRHLVEEPSEQAHRFIRHLSDHKQVHVFETTGGGRVEIDSSKISYYIPLGVTFSHLGRIGSNLKKLIEARVVEKSLEELAPSMAITDLEIVFSILDSEAERVHYLARRREFEAHFTYEGDELDLFAFYLDNGFNIGDSEYDRSLSVDLSPKSKELDPYIIGTSEGKRVKKPNLQMTQWWRDLLGRVQERRFDGWLEICFALLNSTMDDQEKFERYFKNLAKSVKSGAAPKPHNWVMFLTGPERRRFAIAAYPYVDTTREKRNDVMAEILDSEEALNARGAVVIAVDMNAVQRNSAHYPYSAIARRLSSDLFDVLTLHPHQGEEDT